MAGKNVPFGRRYNLTGGDFYSDVTDGKTDLGGAVGVGLRVKLPGILAAG